ncbi:MAG TPA: amidohydrolase family protein, partial [Micromonosporaceae bacterium]
MTDPIAITNVRVFDGTGAPLTDPTTVVVADGLIESVGGPAPAGAIDGTGHTLIPGLIDAHWHSVMAAVTMPVLMSAEPAYLHLLAAREAERTLLRGFTTVRDTGGPAFALKRAIDEGLYLGPRIYPSGAFISQTSGHGDFRALHEIPRDGASPLSMIERIGAAVIADGVPEVMRGVREQLMHGASQIKVMAGGGVSSHYDPIDVTQYTYDEMAAAVECAAGWSTYVLVHAYTPAAVQQAMRAGVKCIDHGHLVDDETVAMMAATGTWWSMQPFLDDEDAIPIASPAGRAKQMQIIEGT